MLHGQLRYITYTDIYELYQYDYTNCAPSLLGAFAPEFDKKYDIFNFTADAVVMLNWGEEYNRKLVVYRRHFQRVDVGIATYETRT